MEESLIRKNEEFDRTIVLADASELPGTGGLNKVNGDLWVWPSEITDATEAKRIFEDPSKTSRIIFRYSKIDQREYEGFSKLISISQSVVGDLSIRLRKE